MKTQISRDSFHPDKKYSGIHQQQGRMLTDADWNELVAILNHRQARALVDVIGNGSPRNGALCIMPDLTIRPGDLYVDGIRAALLGDPKQPFPASKQVDDLPGYPDLPAKGPYVVYADVWDRVVTSLEDHNLRDDGLHGADTCTRTKTMLQVKTCLDSVKPETDIPKLGNATLSLRLHASLEAGDPCDPCAGLVSAGKGRAGNYLFRLEVHEVVGNAGAPTGLTLKWSSENGAEQYNVATEMPPGFTAADHVYEFYELTAEKHVGVFLSPGFSPVRGQLLNGYQVPSPKPGFVRRWDGFCKLTQSGGAWSLDAGGYDRGVALSTTSVATAPGHVSFAGGLQINLNALQITLDLTGKTFVAGDYWLAEIREAVHAAGSPVTTRTTPAGITHHYLRLAGVDKNGAFTTYADDADNRRHSFPPLTDLRAGDVGFDPQCNTGVYQGQSVATVEQALRRLCHLQADQVSYRPGPALGLDINTVQAALDALSARQVGHGCRLTVGEGGVFKTLDEALKTLLEKNATEICFCLLPGDHNFQGGAIEAPRTVPKHSRLCLSGCGGATRLHIASQCVFSNFAGVSLSDMEIVAPPAAPRGALQFQGCEEVGLRSVSVYGLLADGSLVEVRGARNATMQSVLLEAAGPDSSMELIRNFRDLAPFSALNQDQFAARNKFEEAAIEGAHAVLERTNEQREQLALTIERRVSPINEKGAPARDALPPREWRSYIGLAAAVRQNELENLVDALLQVRVEAIRATPAVALAIADASGDWLLRDCDVLGIVTLYGVKPAVPLSYEQIGPLMEFVKDGAARCSGTKSTLRVSGCRATRIAVSDTTMAQLEMLSRAGRGSLNGLFDTGVLTDCTLVGGDNQLATVNANLSSNVFDLGVTEIPPLAALVIANTSIYVGNRGTGAAMIFNITPAGSSERAANLRLQIS